MVLDNVASGTNTVVVAGAPAQADVFSHRDLYVVNVVCVPHRLEDLVGKAQRHDVLHCFLAQVVIDTEDRRLREDGVDNLVELAGRSLIVAKRFLNDDTAPGTLRVV